MFRLGGFRVRMGVMRAVATCFHSPRKRVTPRLLGILACALFAALIISSIKSHLPREDLMELQLASMRDQIRFMETMYRSRHEDVLRLQAKHKPEPWPVMPSEVALMLKNISGTRAAAGAHPRNRDKLNTPFGYQLLPHLMSDVNSLRPAYHMKGNRSFVNVVLGITTVKRDKESYLNITLTHLIQGLEPADWNSTLIVVFVGETDLEYVVQTAHKIEIAFPEAVQSGLIEVLSPSPSFYPKFDTIRPTLGDSEKRFRWRTKGNLDVMYLMAYVQTKGTYYLMLEDDVISKKEYMKEIKNFTAQISLKQPNWFFIEYCPTGGIGKLFRSADLNHFITYVQLFYTNMPIDWLLESYLADRVCTIDKSSKACGKLKMEIRPKFKQTLFKHIGLYSSLKGKIQKVEDSRFGKAPMFYPHKNPRLAAIHSNIQDHMNHTVKRAYHGHTYFWGILPKNGSTIEFWFKVPTVLEKFTFRSGNIERKDDRFYNSVVEVVPTNGNGSFIQVGAFDEFGMAEGELDKKLGPLNAIRIRVTKDSKYWVILSEIDLKTKETPR